MISEKRIKSFLKKSSNKTSYSFCKRYLSNLIHKKISLENKNRKFKKKYLLNKTSNSLEKKYFLKNNIKYKKNSIFKNLKKKKKKLVLLTSKINIIDSRNKNFNFKKSKNFFRSKNKSNNALIYDIFSISQKILFLILLQNFIISVNDI